MLHLVDTPKSAQASHRLRRQVSKPLYEEEILLRYPGRELGDLPPHVYAIAEDAYRKISGKRLPFPCLRVTCRCDVGRSRT